MAMSENEAIQWLKHTRAYQYKCDNCEYIDIKGACNEECKDFYDMAIQALEKQMPKKPEVNEFDYGDGYVCGECESFLHYVDDDDEHIRTNYCCHCGTKIDWQ